MRKHSSPGFTLIELLVVISIISLLSSIVLASLDSARDKAKEAAMKSAVLEFRKLLFLEKSDTGSYANLLPGWITSETGAATSCQSSFGASTYVTQAREICKSIFRNTKPGLFTAPASVDWRIYFGTNQSTVDNFSIMAALPQDNYFWFCVGSSGRLGEYDARPAGFPNGDGYSGQAGCYNNP